MTKALTWLSLLVVLAFYAIIVVLFGFEGPVALAIHFARIAVTVAALIVYIERLPTIFEEVPPPRRDYLLAGINFMLASAVCFSFWNEAGRIFDVDTSIFTNAVAGLFSLFLVVGAGFALIAPDTGGKMIRVIAVAVGVVLSIGLVFIAPLFR